MIFLILYKKRKAPFEHIRLNGAFCLEVLFIKSIWKDTADLPEFPPLKGDTKTDVLIIGGGIVGILTAYFLAQENINYILVNGGRICDRTTGNTTAKITFQHGLIYSKILSMYGKEGAKQYLASNKEAAHRYYELCKNIDCDYEIKDNYVYSLDNRKILEKELEALKTIDYNGEFCEKIPLPINTVGAIKFSSQAQFNPIKFISEISKDLNIYENTTVLEMIGNMAVTNRGKISAEKVIVTTHFPFINKHGSYYLKLYQHRSYVLALENAADVKAMYVDENKKGMSFRNYKNLLLLGGGGHRTGKPGGNWTELRDFVKINYPLAKEVGFWAAQDCMSLDGIPYIGKYSKNTGNLFVASGFNKWGMTGAMTAAMLLKDLIADKPNDFAELYSPSRSIIKPQLFINGFEATTNLLTPTKRRCPHLGCALKWNKAERSWDCPCHGSRFTEKGKVIDNPANGACKKTV